MPYFVPPAAVARKARKGLDLRASLPPSRRGGTAVGVRRAVQLASRQRVSIEVVERMASFFARHAGNRDTPGWGQDSPGWQAWLLWGGDEGRAWARRILARQRERE